MQAEWSTIPVQVYDFATAKKQTGEPKKTSTRLLPLSWVKTNFAVLRANLGARLQGPLLPAPMLDCLSYVPAPVT